MPRNPDFFDDDEEESQESIQDIIERSFFEERDQEMNPDRDLTFEGTDFNDEDMYDLFEDEDWHD